MGSKNFTCSLAHRDVPAFVQRCKLVEEDIRMHTSLLLVALMGPGAAPEALEAPMWQGSYTAARTIAQREGKPLAVFIGSGPAGHGRFVEEGKLSAEAQRLLTEHYVC